MALSLGKPVIFYCDQEQRRRFYRDELETGVAVGGMVPDNLQEVSELISIVCSRIEWFISLSQPSFDVEQRPFACYMLPNSLQQRETLASPGSHQANVPVIPSRQCTNRSAFSRESLSRKRLVRIL
jgi:hypothetical protein